MDGDGRMMGVGMGECWGWGWVGVGLGVLLSQELGGNLGGSSLVDCSPHA